MTRLPLDPSAPLPLFRPTVDAAMVDHEGEPMLLLRDTEGITEQVMLVSPGALLLIKLLNGKNSLSDIKALIMKHTGSLVPELSLAKLVGEFDKLHFLETPETTVLRVQAAEEFKTSPVRKPSLEGLSYPGNPLELASFMASLLKAEGGPGQPLAQPENTPCPAGLAVPDVDLVRGAPAYGWAYRELSKCSRPDVIVAIGVAHSLPDTPWALTEKTYATPLGGMVVDKDLYAKLSACLGYDGKMRELSHKTEYSLEFQALWLKYLWQDNAPAWIPLLAAEAPDPQTADAALDAMCKVLAQEAAAGKKILVLWVSDARLGDKLELDEALLKEIAAAQKITAEEQPDKEPQKPQYGIGLFTIYTASRLLRALAPQAKGRLLNHTRLTDPLGGEVEFSSAVFEETNG